jgi:hypothetical protein
MPNIYQEALSRSISDDLVDEALKPYYFGQTRYTLAQSLFLSVGRECRHQTEVVHCEKNGFPIPVITIGRFSFTTHFAFNADEKMIINSSLVRKQHSIINEEYVQPKLFDVTFNEQKLRAARTIYANIVFGCRGGHSNFYTHGFLRIAVPYLKKSNGREQLLYAENLNYFDVLAKVLEKEQTSQQQKPMVNVAVPKLKITKQG